MKNKKSWYILLMVVGLMVSILVAGKFITRNSYSGPTAELKVALKWLHQAQFAGMYVAKDQGFYEKQNLSVDLLQFEPGKSIVEQVLANEVQFGILGANDILTAINEGADIQAVAAVYQASPYVIASLRGSEIYTPRDLKDKRLGVKGGFNAEGFQVFQLVTTSAGLEKDDVEFVSLDFSTTEKDDLLNETVDAIGLYRTRLFQFEQEGVNFNAIYPEQYGTPVYNDIIFAKTDFINNNPKIVQAFVSATTLGWEEAIDDPETAVQTVMAYVDNEQYEDPAYQRYILSASIPLIKPSNQTKIGEMSLPRWELLREALTSRGVIREDFDVETAFTTRFIK